MYVAYSLHFLPDLIARATKLICENKYSFSLSTLAFEVLNQLQLMMQQPLTFNHLIELIITLQFMIAMEAL